MFVFPFPFHWCSVCLSPPTQSMFNACGRNFMRVYLDSGYGALYQA